MGFPTTRLRRLRASETLRRMIRETRLLPDQLIQPFFVVHGRDVRKPIRSMPGVYQLSVDTLVKEAKESYKLGIPAILLFGIPKKKDEQASEAYDLDGIVQRAVREIKSKIPGLVVITDVCLCEYMSHGHCGIIVGVGGSSGSSASAETRTTRSVEHWRRVPASQDPPQFVIDNDSSLELLTKTALSHAEVGADIVAPSDMMDGRVKAIREGLDQSGFQNTILLSYAVKHASAFYGPFREAAESAPKFGDRKTYQMDPANAREAIREARLDAEEGADIIMVKPAGPSLDLIAAVRCSVNLPVAAYQVSGEYAMIKAAAEKGWLDEKAAMLESLTAIRRAGADLIVTYFARETARSL
ncbi:MAG: porphobilinogen synthase [Deltaproteobacteria bacterium]|nr:porphobilinogen synthase [Deltaproteobacteria bacterium]